VQKQLDLSAPGATDPVLYPRGIRSWVVSAGDKVVQNLGVFKDSLDRANENVGSKRVLGDFGPEYSVKHLKSVNSSGNVFFHNKKGCVIGRVQKIVHMLPISEPYRLIRWLVCRIRFFVDVEPNGFPMPGWVFIDLSRIGGGLHSSQYHRYPVVAQMRLLSWVNNYYILVGQGKTGYLVKKKHKRTQLLFNTLMVNVFCCGFISSLDVAHELGLDKNSVNEELWRNFVRHWISVIDFFKLNQDKMIGVQEETKNLCLTVAEWMAFINSRLEEKATEITGDYVEMNFGFLSGYFMTGNSLLLLKDFDFVRSLDLEGALLEFTGCQYLSLIVRIKMLVDLGTYPHVLFYIGNNRCIYYTKDEVSVLEFDFSPLSGESSIGFDSEIASDLKRVDIFESIRENFTGALSGIYFLISSVTIWKRDHSDITFSLMELIMMLLLRGE